MCVLLYNSININMIPIKLTVKQLIKSGIYIGHQKNRWNTYTSNYILILIKNTYIINLEYTIIALRIVIHFIKETVANKGKLLIIPDKFVDSNNIIDTLYHKFIRYITNNQIISGYLSNSRFVNKEKYIPNIVILFSTRDNTQIIKEIYRFKIPIIALVHTNENPKFITYPIPGNNELIKSIQFFNNIINNTLLFSFYKYNLSFKDKYYILDNLNK